MWKSKEESKSVFDVILTSLWIFCFTHTTSPVSKIGRDFNHWPSLITSRQLLIGNIVDETLEPSTPLHGVGAQPLGQCDVMPRIITATQKGKHNKVLEELNKGVNIDTVDPEGATALYWSACKGDVRLTKFLIEKGANVNHKVNWEATPLHAAVDRGHTDCVECLLTRGAAVNAQNANQDTPLHLAAYRGYYQICLLLLAYNASLSLQNFKGKTPYQEAVEAGHTKIVKILANSTKGSTFPLENKSISELYRSKFTASRNDGSCFPQREYERQNSEGQCSDKRNDVSYSAPLPSIINEGVSNSYPGCHSFPNLNMLPTFPSNLNANSQNLTKYNTTVTKLSDSSSNPHPPLDREVRLHLSGCHPVPSIPTVHVQQRNDRDLFAKIEDLELRLATSESVASALENNNVLLRQENASLREQIASHICSENHNGVRNSNVLLENSVPSSVQQLQEEFKRERELRLAAEARSRQAMKDMFTLRMKLDQLLASDPDSHTSINGSSDDSFSNNVEQGTS